jgi:hypothetical protein
MQRFWIAVGCAVITALLFISLARPQGRTSVGGPLEPWHQPIYYISTGSLVAVVWAIAFRSQVAAMQISLKAVFILVLMEAIYQAAIRIMAPEWAA